MRLNIDIVIIKVEQNKWTEIDETKMTIEHNCDGSWTNDQLQTPSTDTERETQKQPRNLEDATFSGFHLWV